MIFFLFFGGSHIQDIYNFFWGSHIQDIHKKWNVYHELRLSHCMSSAGGGGKGHMRLNTTMMRRGNVVATYVICSNTCEMQLSEMRVYVCTDVMRRAIPCSNHTTFKNKIPAGGPSSVVMAPLPSNTVCARFFFDPVIEHVHVRICARCINALETHSTAKDREPRSRARPLAGEYLDANMAHSMVAFSRRLDLG